MAPDEQSSGSVNEGDINNILTGSGGIVTSSEFGLLAIVGDRLVLAQSVGGLMKTVARSDSIPLPIADIAICHNLAIVAHADGVSTFDVTNGDLRSLQFVPTKDWATGIAVDCDNGVVFVTGGPEFYPYLAMIRINHEKSMTVVNDRFSISGSDIEFYNGFWYLSTGGTMFGGREIISFRATDNNNIAETDRIDVGVEPTEISIVDNQMYVITNDGVVSMSLAASGAMIIKGHMQASGITNVASGKEIVVFGDDTQLFVSRSGGTQVCTIRRMSIHDVAVIDGYVVISEADRIEQLSASSTNDSGRECDTVIVSRMELDGPVLGVVTIGRRVAVLTTGKVSFLDVDQEVSQSTFRHDVTLRGVDDGRVPLRLFRGSDAIVITYNDDSIELISIDEINSLPREGSVLCGPGELGIRSRSPDMNRFDAAITDVKARDGQLLLAVRSQGLVQVRVLSDNCVSQRVFDNEQYSFGALAVTQDGHVFARTNQTSKSTGVGALGRMPLVPSGGIGQWLDTRISLVEFMQLEICGSIMFTAGVFSSATITSGGVLSRTRLRRGLVNPLGTAATESVYPSRLLNQYEGYSTNVPLFPPPPSSDEKLIVIDINAEGRMNLVDDAVDKYDAGRPWAMSCEDNILAIGSTLGSYFRKHMLISYEIDNTSLCCKQERALASMPLGVTVAGQDNDIFVADGDAGLLRIVRTSSNAATPTFESKPSATATRPAMTPAKCYLPYGRR